MMYVYLEKGDLNGAIERSEEAIADTPGNLNLIYHYRRRLAKMYWKV
jgi:hypothetical protein